VVVSHEESRCTDVSDVGVAVRVQIDEKRRCGFLEGVGVTTVQVAVQNVRPVFKRGHPEQGYLREEIVVVMVVSAVELMY
jgi:hypothetical protein